MERPLKDFSDVLFLNAFKLAQNTKVKNLERWHMSKEDKKWFLLESPLKDFLDNSGVNSIHTGHGMYFM